MAAMLDRHPEVAVPEETSFFFTGAVRPRLTKLSTHDALWRELPIWMGHMGGDPERMAAEFKELPPTAHALFVLAMQSYATAQGKSRWAEKSPWHLRHIDLIFEWFPNAKVVCMLRDGRACVESCLKVPFHTRGRAWYALTWRYASRLIRRFEAKYPDDVLVVRYEDLVEAPEQTVAVVDDFLGLVYQPCQVDPAAVTASFKTSQEPWKQRVNEPLDTSRLSAWRETLSAEEHFLYRKLIENELRYRGYPIENYQNIGLVSRLKMTASASFNRVLATLVLWLKSVTGRM